mgnify:CR=1 FL=1
MKNRIASFSFDLIIFLLGFLSLLSPFFFQQARNPGINSSTFPVIVSIILLLCITLVVFEAQSSHLDTKMIALLGVLVAINSGLRFLENAIPGPAGFSPIFFLIIIVGYFFGSKMGFLIGALTLFVSSLITGGVGPWLPGQMITAGWVGQSSALLAPINTLIRIKDKPIEIIILAIFGALWGLLYGVIMNLWFWPFLSSSPQLMWTQTAHLIENIQRYFAYYLATSVIWDITRAIGNFLVITVMGAPVIKIFNRFKKRFSFEHTQRTHS